MPVKMIEMAQSSLLHFKYVYPSEAMALFKIALGRIA
jgi:hypothetical protein